MKRKVGRCRLPELLKKRGWTQEYLAQITNIKRQQINKYYNDEIVMSYPNSRIISKALGVSMEELYE